MLECWDDVGKVRVMFLSVFGQFDLGSKLVFPRYDNPLVTVPVED